ncbi:MAG: CoA transferase [Acidobacteriaceae bacterium]|nr:CoA transferase [Acidobacteriaceae bacterium]
MTTNKVRPLEGLTVLDLTRLLPGAVATQYLADQGARVIKIEQPGVGDYGRTLSPNVFASTNRGKKSVVIDLKQAEGRSVLLQMLSHADILVEGFRPGVMQRLGLDYDSLHTLNRRLIYVSITGYGQQGPDAMLAGHDVNYLAMGGVLGLNCAAHGEPVIPGVQIGDLVGGSMQAVLGILLALRSLQVTGEGSYIDVSMTAGVQSLLTVPLAGPGAEMLNGTFACYNVYRAKDGRWLAVGALETKFWEELCRQLGCVDLIPEQYNVAAQSSLKARLAEIFATRDALDWFERLRGFDCCVTPVLHVSEIRNAVPASNREAPPGLGEHTEELFREYLIPKTAG